MRIGIPRSFYYHQYPKLWETLFRELGHEPVVSGASTARTIGAAASVTEAEHCLPNKLFDGHVASLEGRVDAVFIPRVISMVKGHIACPRFGALPEATRDGVARDIPVLSIVLNVTKEPLERTLRRLGRELGAGRREAGRAAVRALEAMRRWESAHRDRQESGGGGKRFLVLGHPYALRDEFVAAPVLRKLEALGAAVEEVTFENRDFEPDDILWCGFRIMRDRLKHLDPARYAGVVQISTFNCGADSMMIEKFRRLCARGSIPYMVIMVDEHTGTAGIDTRLEAFVDSLAWKDAVRG